MTMDANRTSSGPELKSELARLCLPASRRDPNRRLAWINSICILFLLIGLLGAKPATVDLRSPPPLEQIFPAFVEPPPPPPQAAPEEQKQEQTEPDKPETPRVVVVTPEAPDIKFSVPTIGNLVVPKA